MMANFWCLLFTVFLIFNGSICAPVENICGDSKLQYVFFLLPPSNDIPELTEFLTSVNFAIVLVKPEDHGIVRVVCDPEDSREIYRYTKARDMYLLHSAYCIGNGEFSSLEEFRSGGKKVGKIPVKGSPVNLINKEKSQGRKKTEDKNSLEELNAEASRVLKYSRIPKPRENHPLQLSIDENSPRKTTSKNTGTKLTPASNPARKSLRKQSGSWIERSFDRLKIHSSDFITHGKNYQEETHSAHDGKTGDFKNATLPSRGPGDTEIRATIFGNYGVNRSRITSDVIVPKVSSTLSKWENNKQSAKSMKISKLFAKKKDETDDEGVMSVGKLTRNRRESTNATTERIPKDSTTIRNEEKKLDDEDDEVDEDDEDEDDTVEEDSDEDHNCMAAEIDTLGELADHIQSILNWVRRLETRGKKG